MKKVVTILMLLVIFGLSKSIAQTDVLISQSSVTYSDLNAAQQARYDTIAAHLAGGVSTGYTIYFINIASISADTLNKGIYQIVMPFLNYDSIILSSSFVQYTSDSNYSWTGNIIDQ